MAVVVLGLAFAIRIGGLGLVVGIEDEELLVAIRAGEDVPRIAIVAVHTGREGLESCGEVAVALGREVHSELGGELRERLGALFLQAPAEIRESADDEHDADADQNREDAQLDHKLNFYQG